MRLALLFGVVALVAVGSAQAGQAANTSVGPQLPVSPASAPAEPARYALVVEGVSGDPAIAVQQRKWLDDMVAVLHGKLGYDASHVIVLAETPKDGEQKSTADGARSALSRLSKILTPTDQLFVMLIGHGAGDGPDVTYNLVGPDMPIKEWNMLLTAIPGHLVFVDCTGESFPFLAGLAGPNRIIVTATRTAGERYDTVFADSFIKAFSDPAADLDKNGRVSIWEAFAYASKDVAAHYDREGHLATEHALLDDTGKGMGRDGSATDQSGTVAGLTYLDAVTTPTTSDASLQALYDRQKALTQQIDDLRRRRSTMTPEEFDQAFEPLEVELSRVSQEIRQKGGGGG